MRANPTSVTMSHYKIPIVSPTLAPRISYDPLVFLRLSHNSNRMIKSESLAIGECSSRVPTQISSINHRGYNIAFNKLALYSLAVTSGQYLKSWYLVCFCSFYCVFFAFVGCTSDWTIWILLGSNKPCFSYILVSFCYITVIAPIWERVVMSAVY